MGGLNYEKAKRDERMKYTPSWRVLAATSKQLDFIRDLARQKGQPYRPPKTKHGASEMIDRLLGMPAIEAQIQERKETKRSEQKRPLPYFEQELQKQLGITPQQSQAFVYLCEQADPIGYPFFFEDFLNDKISVEDHNEDTIAKLMSLFACWREGSK